jgi:hypothetical protein
MSKWESSPGHGPTYICRAAAWVTNIVPTAMALLALAPIVGAQTELSDGHRILLDRGLLIQARSSRSTTATCSPADLARFGVQRAATDESRHARRIDRAFRDLRTQRSGGLLLGHRRLHEKWGAHRGPDLPLANGSHDGGGRAGFDGSGRAPTDRGLVCPDAPGSRPEGCYCSPTSSGGRSSRRTSGHSWPWPSPTC